MRTAVFSFLLFRIVSITTAEYVMSLQVQNSPINHIPEINDWMVDVTTEQTFYIAGVCPLGFYCPGNEPDPYSSPLGTYCPEPGRNTPCDELCPLNHFCPDPGSIAPCPEHTTSPKNSTSKLSCKCDLGYVCTYTKQTKLHLVLHMPLEAWLYNQTVQKLLRQAVALAASVPLAKVQIDHVLPVLAHHRRMFSTSSWRNSTPQRLRVDLTIDHHHPVSQRALYQQFRRIKHAVNVVSHRTRTIDHIHTRKRFRKSFLTA